MFMRLIAKWCVPYSQLFFGRLVLQYIDDNHESYCRDEVKFTESEACALDLLRYFLSRKCFNGMSVNNLLRRRGVTDNVPNLVLVV